jgi:hypothetical protein
VGISEYSVSVVCAVLIGKHQMKKQILLGILSLGMGLSAHAALISGNITFRGGVELDEGSVDTASQVTDWVDPRVQSRSGDFAGSVAVNDSVAFFAPWSFNSGPLAAFWSVGGFTFNLLSSSIQAQGDGFLTVSGTGTIIGNGFEATTGTWRFSTQDDAADGEFSFSAASRSVPDGGMTVVLLGLALSGLGFVSRKFVA